VAYNAPPDDLPMFHVVTGGTYLPAEGYAWRGPLLVESANQTTEICRVRRVGERPWKRSRLTTMTEVRRYWRPKSGAQPHHDEGDKR
jgi:hypothetical protein